MQYICTTVLTKTKRIMTKKEETQSKTVRLPLYLVEHLTEHGTSLSEAIRTNAATLEAIESILDTPSPLPSPDYLPQTIAALAHTVNDIGQVIPQQPGLTLAETVIADYMALTTIRLQAMQSVRTIFTPNEWKYLADALNGNLIENEFRFNAAFIAASVEDADIYNGLATTYKIADLARFIDKIHGLSAAHTEAVHRRVEKYWDNYQTVDLDKWAGELTA